VVVPPDVAPFGDAPPPVGPVAPPDVPPPEVPPPEVPEDEFPLLPDVPEEPPDELEDPDEPEEPDEAELEGEELFDDEVEVVFVVEVVAPLVVAGAALIVCVGTVRGGAPDVSVVAVPPPHAASVAHALTPATSAAMRPSGLRLGTAERRVTTETSDFERLHAPPAVRAVVEVLLAELVAPVAETKVLDGPGQLGRRRGEGQELGDDLERFAGVTIEIGLAGLGFDHDFPPGRWRSHPVLLTRPHEGHRIAGPGHAAAEPPCRRLG
jgi:hypothetical protein